MLPLLNVLFILSLHLLLLCLHLIKHIFQLYVILLSCLMFLLSRRQTSQRPSSDSPLVPDLPPPPAPIVEPNLPVVIHKGIRSTRNPSPHYTALSYHRLRCHRLYYW